MSDKFTRRDFLRLAGGSAAALAVLTGCGPASRYVKRQPYFDMPEYNQTGKDTHYATTCRECPAGCGLIVRTREGRAIKIEGNPIHPVNRGKICSRGLTAVQGLYNPDRLQGPRRQEGRSSGVLESLSWDEAVAIVAETLRDHSPDSIAFLLGLNHDHLGDLVRTLVAGIGSKNDPVAYSAQAMLDGRPTLLQAARQAFGVPAEPHFDLANADLAFVFGADILGTFLSPVYFSRAYGQFRKGRQGRRGTMVVFDAHQSLTASNADEWIPIKPGSEAQLLQGLITISAQMMGIPLPAEQMVDITEVSTATGIMGTTLVHLAELFTKAEYPLAIAGGSALGGANGLAVAQLALALNALVDNLGQSGGVSIAATPDFSSAMQDVKNLVDRMKAGEVQALFIHGANPVFELPSALGFTEALKNVAHVISFNSYLDETGGLSDYILPDHTPLESFGYQSALTGSDRPVLSSLQPVVAPLYETRATADVLLAAVKKNGGPLAERLSFADEVDFIQQGLSSIIDTPNGIYQAKELKTFWAKWLQNGGWWTSEPVLKAPDATTIMQVPVTVKPAAQPPAGFDLHLVVYPTNLGDGSGANRPWLQETPNPLTTAMWGSWVEINPETARELGIEDDDIVRVTSPVGEVEAPAYLYPGVRLDTIAIPFGQGHTLLGRYAQERGCNPVNLLEVTLNGAGEIAFGATFVKVVKTGSRKHLARAESRHGIYGEEE